jgi:hypothetical protein
MVWRFAGVALPPKEGRKLIPKMRTRRTSRARPDHPDNNTSGKRRAPSRSPRQSAPDGSNNKDAEIYGPSRPRALPVARDGYREKSGKVHCFRTDYYNSMSLFSRTLWVVYESLARDNPDRSEVAYMSSIVDLKTLKTILLTPSH